MKQTLPRASRGPRGRVQGEAVSSVEQCLREDRELLERAVDAHLAADHLAAYAGKVDLKTGTNPSQQHSA